MLDKKITNVHAHRYMRIIDYRHVEHYDLIDYDETVYYEENLWGRTLNSE